MDDIGLIRQFNRTLTQHIGVLENHFLGRKRSIGASRVLFEIGSQGMTIRDLRNRLGLDSGYVSRLLRSLETEGLVEVASSAGDARVRSVHLSAKGHEELAILNRLSDETAKSMLEPLNPRQRLELIQSMNAVERLVRASATNIEIQDPTHPMAQACLAHYFRELSERFEQAFDPSISISANPEELTPPKGFFLVAELYGQPIGCGGLKCHVGFGEIKRMWVSPAARGLGIGKRILFQLEVIAFKEGLSLLRLETNKALLEAQRLYRNCGYQEVAPFNNEPYAHHWFEKRLPAPTST